MSRTADDLRYHNTKYYGIEIQEEIFKGKSYYFLIELQNGGDMFVGETFPTATQIELFRGLCERGMA